MCQAEHLALFLEPTLAGRWFSAYPVAAPIVFKGRQYRGSGIDSIFYDFIFTARRRVSGVQIFPVVAPDSAIFKLFEGPGKLTYIELREGVPTVWLSTERSGEPRGMEAFAMDYLVADDDHWAVLFPIGAWLSAEEGAAMRDLPIAWV